MGLTLVLGAPTFAQSTTAIAGAVHDEQNAAIPGVSVSLRQSSSGLERQTTTDVTGRYEIANLPVGVHDLTFSLPGFAAAQRRVHAATSARVELDIQLDLAAMTDAIQVVPQTTVVDSSSAGTRHSVAITRVERMPVAVTSRGLESVLVTLPGFAQNANGAIHPRGAHNQMTYVVDGLPISDQLTGAFANALDGGLVQAAELWTGNIPAEFGAKVSGVVVHHQPQRHRQHRRACTGEVSMAASGFRHLARLGPGRRASAAASATSGRPRSMRTDRFLDQVIARQPAQRRARSARGFLRADVRLDHSRPSSACTPMGGSSRFELANLRSQQAARPGPAPAAQRRVGVELARADASMPPSTLEADRRLPDDDRRHCGPAPAIRPSPRPRTDRCRPTR